MSGKSKKLLREFWILESEYGWDTKRYVRTIHASEREAKTLKRHLDIKHPQDRHLIFYVKEQPR